MEVEKNMETVDLVIECATVFYNKAQKNANDRFYSWEHCYKCFYDARDKRPLNSACYDYLSLQLAFYLASWGMYRGSSFLLQKDYKIHTPVVEELLKPEYDKLLGCEYSVLEDEKMQDKLKELVDFIKNYYDKIRKSVNGDVKSNLSQILITKILMGTLGCVPAYDKYFCSGIIGNEKRKKITTKIFDKNLNSLRGLIKFYKDNSEKLEKARQNFKVYGLPYPQMKLLDMGFWQIGFENK